MALKEVWNVSAVPLVVNVDRPAVQPGESALFDETTAKGLLVSPDWANEDPRKPRTKKPVSTGPQTEPTNPEE